MDRINNENRIYLNANTPDTGFQAEASMKLLSQMTKLVLYAVGIALILLAATSCSLGDTEPTTATVPQGIMVTDNPTESVKEIVVTETPESLEATVDALMRDYVKLVDGKPVASLERNDEELARELLISLLESTSIDPDNLELVVQTFSAGGNEAARLRFVGFYVKPDGEKVEEVGEKQPPPSGLPFGGYVFHSGLEQANDTVSPLFVELHGEGHEFSVMSRADGSEVLVELDVEGNPVNFFDPFTGQLNASLEPAITEAVDARFFVDANHNVSQLTDAGIIGLPADTYVYLEDGWMLEEALQANGDTGTFLVSVDGTELQDIKGAWTEIIETVNGEGWEILSQEEMQEFNDDRIQIRVFKSDGQELPGDKTIYNYEQNQETGVIEAFRTDENGNKILVLRGVPKGDKFENMTDEMFWYTITFDGPVTIMDGDEQVTLNFTLSDGLTRNNRKEYVLGASHEGATLMAQFLYDTLKF